MNKIHITVVSLGPGDPELLNMKTSGALRNARRLILRTGKHPLSSWLDQNLITYETLDSLYEEAEDFDQLNQLIADYLIEASKTSGTVYAVPDALTDHTVKALLGCHSENLTVDLIPGTSAYDIHGSSLLSHITTPELTVVPAYDFLNYGYPDPNHSVLITELDNPILAGQIKIRLSEIYGDEYEVFLTCGNNKPVLIQLYQLDRHSDLDHRSAVFVPGSEYINRNRFVTNDLLALMDRLRSREGCPWDQIQTHLSLRSFLVEEAWECVDAINQNDMDHLCEELGDLLFQVVFHSSIGRSFDEFPFHDVIASVCSKMIRRHPHVFGGQSVKDANSVKTAWEQIKQQENGRDTVIESLDDVSEGLPALKYAAKSFKKLNRTKASADRSPACIASELREAVYAIVSHPDGATEKELGLMLLKCAELCYVLGADGELVLHQSVVRMRNRLKSAEKKMIRDGKSFEDLTFSELGVYLKYVEDEIE